MQDISWILKTFYINWWFKITDSEIFCPVSLDLETATNLEGKEEFLKHMTKLQNSMDKHLQEQRICGIDFCEGLCEVIAFSNIHTELEYITVIKI